LKGGVTINNLDKEKVTYIYNFDQINFYFSKGICPREIGVHPQTRKSWCKFGWDQTTDVFVEWVTRKKSV